MANGLSALVGGALPATMFFLALYLQRVLGMDPLEAGLALTPGAVGIALGARGASRWMAVLGPRRSFSSAPCVCGGGAVLAVAGSTSRAATPSTCWCR